MQTINDRFRIIFEESGLSQKAFADAIKRSRGEVANIIYDKTAPKEKIIEAVCERFGYSEEWVVNGLEPKKVDRTRDEKIAELVGAAMNGSNGFKKAVIEMLCSRSEDELKVLEKALRDIYEKL